MPVASIELSSTHFHNYLFIFVLKCVVEMALFKYLTKEKDKLVEGEEFVKANELVAEINESRGGSPTPSKRGTYTICSPTPSKRGTYTICSPKQRYEIGKYASEHGNARDSRKFSPMFDKKISESTVRGFKSVYQKEIKKNETEIT